ncbi:MAG: hypothetical protein Q9167_005295 [Letrouitia subvulpina]
MPLMWLQNLSELNGNIQSQEKILATNSSLPFPPAIDDMWTLPKPSNRRNRENLGLLHAQKERFEKDWAIVSASLPEAAVDIYSYYCSSKTPVTLRKGELTGTGSNLVADGPNRNYVLAEQGPCHRTQVALRTITLSDDNWHRFLNGIEPDDLQDEVKANEFIERHVIEPFLAEVRIAISILERRDEQCSTAPRKILLSRWRQIMALLQFVAGKVQRK